MAYCFQLTWVNRPINLSNACISVDVPSDQMHQVEDGHVFVREGEGTFAHMGSSR